MTISTEANKKQYDGNDLTTAFSFPYKFDADEDVVVVLTDVNDVDTTQVITTNYTLTGAGGETGGTVTMIVAPATGERLTIYRKVDLVQETDLSNQGAYFLETLEDALDYITMIVQQQQEEINRSITFVDTSETTGVDMPEPEAGYYLRWNSAGTNLQNVVAVSSSIIAVSDFWKTVVDEANLVDSLTALGLDVDLATLALPASTTISAFAKTLLDDADAAAVRTTLAAAKTGVNSDITSLAALNILPETFGLAATVTSKALTVSLKTAAGTDASITDPIYLNFRSATAATGTLLARTVTGALSVVLSNGSTLGFGAAETGRLYVWAIDNEGTVVLGLSRTAEIFPEGNLVSTTAEGGAGAADSATVMYSTSAQTSKAVKCLGYIEIETGAVAGEWDNAPTKIQIMEPGVKRTGDIVQVPTPTQTGAVATGTTVMVDDDTIPQITEGDEYMTAAITPTSACNKLKVDVIFNWAHSAQTLCIMGLFQDDVTNALAAVSNINVGAGNEMKQLTLTHYMVAGTTSAITFRVRAGSTEGTLTFNGKSTARKYGGVCASSIMITEIMA